MEQNLTKGSVFKNIVIFSLPFMMSYFLQTLYGLADLFIIGQFCGTESTTAVSIGSQAMHMLTVMIVGLAMGATVLIGKSVGSGDAALKNKAIGNTVSLFGIVSVALTAGLLLLAMPIVQLLATPEEAVDGTYIYLMVCFAGIPFITAYNVISAVLRGMGDSKSPMYFVGIACVCNIGLDYLFIGVCGLGAMGAALGTTLAQTISVALALWWLLKGAEHSALTRSDFHLQKKVVGDIVKVGLPVAAQDGFIQISFLLITIFANMRGLSDAAAVGVVEKLIGILFLVPSSLLSSVSALCAQNIGAGFHERARKTMWYALAISASVGCFFAVLFQFIAPYAVDVFVDDPQVVLLGAQYMRSYVWDCILAGTHFIFSGFFCAYSKSGISFFHNLVSIVLARIPLAYLASVNFPGNLYPMGWAAPIGSSISIVICVIFYVRMRRHTEMK